MTLEENSIVADAQGALQAKMREVRDPVRRAQLTRVALMGLLEIELGVNYVREDAGAENELVKL